MKRTAFRILKWCFYQITAGVDAKAKATAFEYNVFRIKNHFYNFYYGPLGSCNRIRQLIFRFAEILGLPIKPRIAVVIMSALGDSVFALPALKRLHEKYPDALLEVSGSHVFKTGASELLALIPWINRVTTKPSRWPMLRFDLSKYFFDLRIHDVRYATGVAPWVQVKHLYFRMIELLGFEAKKIDFPFLFPPFDDTRRQKVERCLSMQPGKGLTIGFEIFVAGGKRVKQWDMERFVTVFNQLREKMPEVRLYAITREKCELFDSLSVANIYGLSIPELMCFLAKLDLVVVLQSGMAVLAGAMDLPLVQIMGGDPKGLGQTINPRATHVEQTRPWDVNSIEPSRVTDEIMRRLQDINLQKNGSPATPSQILG